jgi:hypothetical protein
LYYRSARETESVTGRSVRAQPGTSAALLETAALQGSVALRGIVALQRIVALLLRSLESRAAMPVTMIATKAGEIASAALEAASHCGLESWHQRMSVVSTQDVANVRSHVLAVEASFM